MPQLGITVSCRFRVKNELGVKELRLISIYLLTVGCFVIFTVSELLENSLSLLQLLLLLACIDIGVKFFAQKPRPSYRIKTTFCRSYFGRLLSQSLLSHIFLFSLKNDVIKSGTM